METIKEKRSAGDFKKSEEYLNLEKEIKESVLEALQSKEGEDIEPVMRLFDKRAVDWRPNAALREKLFWSIVADSLKESAFEAIYKKIHKLIEDGQYGAAEQTINNSLTDIIKQLSPTIHRKLDKRGPALIELKNKFFEFLPEVGTLIGGAKEGKKLLTKVPGGKFIEQGEKDLAERLFDYMGAARDEEGPLKYPRFVKERAWEVPALEEIKPGLVVEYENIELNFKSKFVVRSLPDKNTNGDLFVVTDDGKPPTRCEVFLADRGIVPYNESLWNGWQRPTRWYMEENITK